jgi:hypothetical protein
LAIGRFPTKEELLLLESFYQEELENIDAEKIDPEEYFANGHLKIEENIDHHTIAALAIATHNLLNTYEAQMKK